MALTAEAHSRGVISLSLTKSSSLYSRESRYGSWKIFEKFPVTKVLGSESYYFSLEGSIVS